MVKQKKPFPMEELRRHYPFQSHFMDIGGHSLHYVDEGRGAPILMLHGNPTWSFYYRHLIKTFSHEYRTIAPDHIGCGLSDKPPSEVYPYTLDQRVSDLETFLSALDLKEKITLVVHDWGGMIGMAWAVNNVHRIARIVVLNTAAFFPPGGKSLPIRLRIIRNAAFFSKPAVLGLNLFARGALWMAVEKPLSKSVKRCLVAPYDSWKNRVATYYFVKDIPLHPLDPSFATVLKVSRNLYRLSRRPVLICWGAHDFVFDLDYFKEWRQRFPEAESHMLEDSGHYILEDSPEQVANLMAEFFKKTNHD